MDGQLRSNIVETHKDLTDNFLIILFDVFGLFLILFAVLVGIRYRRKGKFEKGWTGIWSALVLLVLVTVLRDLDVIQSNAGWVLVGISLVIFWASLIVFFFKEEKR